MATMRDIKRRKSSIESTEQITKAMKLVATVKLQKSRTKAENSRLYFNLMYQTIQEMLKKSTGIRHRYLKSGDSKKKAVIVVSSNRGLAGGAASSAVIPLNISRHNFRTTSQLPNFKCISSAGILIPDSYVSYAGRIFSLLSVKSELL